MADGTEAGGLLKADYPQLKLEDRWILTRLSQVVGEVTRDYEKYRVAELSQTLYRFVWNEFCDWYLECIKPRLYAEANSSEKKLAASVFVTVLNGVLRLLHPVMPFVTEELWHKLPGSSETIMKAAWPKEGEYPTDNSSLGAFATLQEIVTAIRTSRSELNVPPSAHVMVSTHGDGVKFDPSSQQAALLKTLCRVSVISETSQRPIKSALAVVKSGEIYIHLEGLIDLKAEAVKQQKEREKLAKYFRAIEEKLKNEQFMKNAPEELVTGEKVKLQETQDKITRIDNNLKFLEN